MITPFKRRRQRPTLEPNQGQNDVQTVFSDLVCFIMMLFILLFVLAHNEKKTEEFVAEFQINFRNDKQEREQKLTTEVLLLAELEDFIKKEDLSEQAEVIVDEYRVKLILTSPVLFDSGSAMLKPGGQALLQRAGTIFDEVTNELVVEGHTDDVPISNKTYGSNWELSFFRAFSVLKYYVTTRGYLPTRLSALGYGEFRPLVPNTSAKNRALNRRIELSVIRFDR